MADVQTLTSLYNAKRDELGEHGRPISHREAARRGGDEGKYETLRLIGAGQHSGRISEDVLGVLVRLGLNERQVRRAAGLQLEHSPGQFELPARAARLTLQQRKVVLSVVDGLLDAYEQGRRDEAASTGRADSGLRAVASGQRGSKAAAQREANSKAGRARGSQEAE